MTAHLALAVAVVDAPMILASTSESANSLTLVPWVRVVRHEAVESEDSSERSLSYVACTRFG